MWFTYNLHLSCLIWKTLITFSLANIILRWLVSLMQVFLDIVPIAKASLLWHEIKSFMKSNEKNHQIIPLNMKRVTKGGKKGERRIRLNIIGIQFFPHLNICPNFLHNVCGLSTSDRHFDWKYLCKDLTNFFFWFQFGQVCNFLSYFLMGFNIFLPSLLCTPAVDFMPMCLHFLNKLQNS